MKQQKMSSGKKLFLFLIFTCFIILMAAAGLYGLNKMSPGFLSGLLPDVLKPEITIEKTEVTREIQMSTAPFWKTLAGAFFALILVLLVLFFLSKRGSVIKKEKNLTECIKIAKQNATLSPHLSIKSLIYWQPAFENGEHKRYGLFFSTRLMRQNEPLSTLRWNEIYMTDISAMNPQNDSTGFRTMTVDQWEKWKKNIRSGETGEQLTPTKAVRPMLFSNAEIDSEIINEQTNVEIGRQIGARAARGQVQ
jgi:hypothetical protein